MVKIPRRTHAGKDPTKEACVAKFREWWDAGAISTTISKVNPEILRMIVSGGNIINPDRLAEMLYDIVGPHFLKNVDNDNEKRRTFLELILDAAVGSGDVRSKDIVQAAKSTARKNERDIIRDVRDVPNLTMTARLARRLAMELGLPTQVADAEHADMPARTEVIVPHSPLNPLYDYQYTTGRLIRRMLGGEETDENQRKVKRKMITIPTGAGKTRMVAETVIGWLNDGKPSDSEQQSDSKFVLWVAQSSELCEQAFSTFKAVFQSVGRHGTTLHMHRFWGTHGKLPDMDMDDLLDEKGVIVATIQSLHKLLGTGQLADLAELTSCIVVDEAHHAVASSYSKVLREMGFNWDNKKSEISERGIILIGLTATPFRGTGGGSDTERLKRWFNGVYFPDIPYSKEIENFRPHALVDCQTYAHAGEYVNILGERSYDRDGYIDDKDYFWRIVRWDESRQHGDEEKSKDEWTFERSKNIAFRPEKPGEYEITLKVIDNEGDYDTATARMHVREKPGAEDVETRARQRMLYEKLTKRNILCNVYHRVLKSRRFSVDMDEVKHMEMWGEFSEKTLKSVEEDSSRNAMIVGEIDALKRMGMKKILFFGCSVAHSRMISVLLKTKYNIRSDYVDANVGIDARVNTIERFKSGDLEVLCNFNILTAGFDAPNVDCVFVGRPVRSTLLYTQMIGRGMRGTKTGGTENMMLVDINDNFQLKSGKSLDIANLGWRAFSDHWTYLRERSGFPGAVQDITQEKVEPAPSEDHEHALSHTCAVCGVEAVGIESIQRIFGIVGHPKVLTASLMSKDRQGIPQKCQACRGAGDIQVPEPSVRSKTTAPLPAEDAPQEAEPEEEGGVPTAEEIDEEFRYLKDEVYAHVPTSRQFWELARVDVRESIDRLYGGYREYLKAKGIPIRGERALEDNLYDEYFELYIKTNRRPGSGEPIPTEELHRYGRYRVEDYKECFGSLEEFEDTVAILIHRVQNIAKNVSMEDLMADYDTMTVERGREPHFEEIRSMSKFGIEHYLNLFGSLSRFRQIRSLQRNR